MHSGNKRARSSAYATEPVISDALYHTLQTAPPGSLLNVTVRSRASCKAAGVCSESCAAVSVLFNIRGRVRLLRERANAVMRGINHKKANPIFSLCEITAGSAGRD